MAAESKTGCFLNFPKKSLSGPAGDFLRIN